MSDLTRVLRETGHPACPQVIRKITKAAGYRWRKARIVLTSSDPNYTEKLDRIRSILSELRSDEAFFSIDEFGPFAVKMKPGRMLSAPGEQRVVPQWQKSRGCMIMTAALELSGNQVTHFYSPRKNTAEMIRMMELLVQKYVTAASCTFPGMLPRGTSRRVCISASRSIMRASRVGMDPGSRPHHCQQARSSSM